MPIPHVFLKPLRPLFCSLLKYPCRPFCKAKWAVPKWPPIPYSYCIAASTPAAVVLISFFYRWIYYSSNVPFEKLQKPVAYNANIVPYTQLSSHFMRLLVHHAARTFVALLTNLASSLANLVSQTNLTLCLFITRTIDVPMTLAISLNPMRLMESHYFTNQTKTRFCIQYNYENQQTKQEGAGYPPVPPPESNQQYNSVSKFSMLNPLPFDSEPQEYLSFSRGFSVLFDYLRPAVVRLYGSPTTSVRDARFLGSGLIFKPNGSIITAAHLFENSTDGTSIHFQKHYVRLYNNQWYESQLLATSPGADVALLKIRVPATASISFPFIPLSDTRDRPRQGEFVVTYGTAEFGDEPVAVVGTVSQPFQSFRNFEEGQRVRYIQLGMITMPGMSGAPVCDVKGRIVAMIVKKFREYGLALPSCHLLNVVKCLEASGYWKPPFLGIALSDSHTPCEVVGEAMSAREIESRATHLRQNSGMVGVHVEEVKKGSRAARAGIQRGDIIQTINGYAIYTNSDLVEQVGYLEGEVIKLGIVRCGQEMIVQESFSV